MRYLLLCAALVQAGAQPAAVEYNRDVRPILSDKCFTCHGPDAATRKTKMRLDVPEGSRYAITAGDPSKSSLYLRITTDNRSLRMPPAYSGHEKLTDAEIDTIKRWIESGAHYQSHWSLIAPRRPAGNIDLLVRARLEREGLKPSPEADRRTLIRRVTLDLTGVPPTPAETNSTDSYEKIVDRLLASPRYAERMAFRWMEAARYADTNGYQTDGNRDMWRWRDWVIDAFARNMPYNQFTIEQIAGDLLPNATLDQKIASGFHRNHRTTAEGGIVPEEYRTEYVADRVETTSSVWLGLTVGCARCHDHKYDPIPQKDFYRLFAFFNNVPEKGLVYNWGNDEPLMAAPTTAQAKELAILDTAVAQAEARWKSLDGDINKAARKSAKRTGDWTITEDMQYRWNEKRRFDGKDFVEAGKDIANFNYLQPFTFSAWIQPEAPTGSILSHDEDYAEGSGHGLHLVDGKLRLHVVFRWTDIGMRLETADAIPIGKWQHVSVTYDGSRYAKGVRIYVDGQEQKLKVLFDELNWPMDFKVPFRIGAGAGLRFTGTIGDVRVYKRELPGEEVAVLAGRNEPHRARLFYLATGATPKIREAEAALRSARKARDEFRAKLPTVMIMSDAAPRQTFILKRGAYDAPGEPVTPGVLSILPPLPEGARADRLALAKWLVDPANPLTARVTVNRLWAMLFGTGLVKTVDDFGSQGEWPIHPELLDWLAVEFVESGWDVKHILKTIVMSDTYRQSSKVTPELLAKDPENRLLARGARFRLGPEMIRDQALFISKLLVEKIGGPSVKPLQPAGLWQELAGGKGYIPDTGEGLHRRSLYTFWKRTIAPPFMVNFDSPNRETCTVRETRTNTPLQALNLMNDPAFIEAAEHLGKRMVAEGGSTDDDKVAFGYFQALGRAPKRAEIDAFHAFLSTFRAKNTPKTPPGPWLRA